MQVRFKNEKNESYILGAISFDWIDRNNIFDKYQEDTDYNSDIVFKCTSKRNLDNLADEIQNLVDTTFIRSDLEPKIIGFVNFLKNSKTILTTID